MSLHAVHLTKNKVKTNLQTDLTTVKKRGLR